MSKLTVSTNLNIDLEFSIPGFHKRMFAWIIDFIICLIYIFAAFRFLGIIEQSDQGFMENNGWSVFLMIILPLSMYPLVSEYLLNGQTIGKKILKLRIINETGGNASFSQYMIRWLMRVSDFFMIFIILATISRDTYLIGTLSFFFLLLIADIICISTTKKSQRLGDLLAGTLLIEKEKAHSIDETVFMQTSENYIPKYPEVMKLRDIEITRIKNIYDNAWEKQDHAIAERTAAKICKVLNIEYQSDAFAFINTLLKDYNYFAQNRQ